MRHAGGWIFGVGALNIPFSFDTFSGLLFVVTR